MDTWHSEFFRRRDERHGVLATLWFNVAHYALRPWPWILTALVSVVLYPDLADKEAGYIQTFMDPAVFPRWLRGFMIAGFAAAYMSTVATQLNWGASYVINDFYRRFIVRGHSERHYVVASQVVTVLIMAISMVVTLFLTSVGDAWKLLLVIGAGTGLVLLLRWYWWRINAWSEVAAMIAAAAVSLSLRYVWRWDTEGIDFSRGHFDDGRRHDSNLDSGDVPHAARAAEQLIKFYRRVRPAGPGWAPIATLAGDDVRPQESLIVNFINWVLGCAWCMRLSSASAS